MKSPRIALRTPTPRVLRPAACLALLTAVAVMGGCKMSPAMEARNEARNDARKTPAAAGLESPPAPPSDAPPAPVDARALPPPARPVAGPIPLPATTTPGAPRTADRGERTLGPTPIGQMAPEEAPPGPTGR